MIIITINNLIVVPLLMAMVIMMMVIMAELNVLRDNCIMLGPHLLAP